MVKPWREVSVLIAGCGSIGRRHARVLHRLGVGDIRACDPDPAQRAALQAETPVTNVYNSFEAGLRDSPETVLICTPPKLHLPMAAQALHAGCHVLCEKPLSDTPAGIDELAALATALGKKVMVGLCFRYHAGLVKAKQLLEAGRVGRLVSIRALMGEHLPAVRPDYRRLFSAQYLGAFDLSHEVDLAIWYAGQPVRRVQAAGGAYSDIGISAPDVAEIVLDFQNRCLASIHLDFFQQPRRRQIELIGTGGVVVVEFARWEHCTVSVFEASAGEWQHEDLATERDDMFSAEDREFLQAVAQNRAITCTIAEAEKSVAVIAAARRSIEGYAPAEFSG